MQLDRFSALVDQGYNRIPIYRQILVDFDTPLSLYRKLADAPFSYLFESVTGGEKWGRYSIIGLPATEYVAVVGHEVSHCCDGQVTTENSTDPLAWIEAFHAQYKVPDVPELPRFNGGLVGYFGYETIGLIEPKLALPTLPDPIGAPDILLMVSDQVAVVDNVSGQLYLIVMAEPDGYAAAVDQLDALEKQLNQPLTPVAPYFSESGISEDSFKSMTGREQYHQTVERVREYIQAGDVMQVVPSQRMQIEFEAPALDLYRALRTLNPSPYMYLLDLGDFHVVGSSPEILVRLEDEEVTVRPIAGTRKRGLTATEDEALAEELLADPKELAEHLMLIDLGRNDAGRVSEIGSVQLTDKMVIERYSHVMHIVSNVTGKLLPGKTAMDVLKATFPAGTVSGAPKIRAMEIIHEMEPVKRGVYSGAVGYLSWNGNMDTAIAIRTAVIKDGLLNIQAGGGLVYDSDPEMEWQETLNKGRAVFRAAELACNGLKDNGGAS